MAAATDTGQRIDPRLTTNRKLFAQQVSRGTGLNETVVDAWVLAEGGPDSNPLNVGPGKRYSSPLDAAAAVVRLLHTDTYKPVLNSATRTPEQQIAAIAASPWNGGFKATAATHKGYLDLLRGVYEHLKPSSTTIGGSIDSSVTGAAGAVAGAVGGAVDAVTGGVGGAISGVEGWAAGAAVTALAYLVLTVASLVLFTVGMSRLFGVSLPAVAGIAATRGRTRPGEGIPF